MPRPDIRILATVQTVSFIPGMTGPRDVIRVEFNVGERGPFMVEIPKAEYTLAKVEEEIERLAAVTRELG